LEPNLFKNNTEQRKVKCINKRNPALSKNKKKLGEKKGKGVTKNVTGQKPPNSRRKPPKQTTQIITKHELRLKKRGKGWEQGQSKKIT